MDVAVCRDLTGRKKRRSAGIARVHRVALIGSGRQCNVIGEVNCCGPFHIAAGLQGRNAFIKINDHRAMTVDHAILIPSQTGIYAPLALGAIGSSLGCARGGWPRKDWTPARLRLLKQALPPRFRCIMEGEE
jgi:hypothetical protein